MWSVKKIMVPTDFSQASEAALDAAIELAKKFESSVCLVHVCQIPAYAYPVTPISPWVDLTSHVEVAASRQLAVAAAAVAVSSSPVPLTTVLRVGAPWEQILRASKEHETDLIVMGSRGMQGLPRSLMGSTAERVVRHSPIPVMTLHGPLSNPSSRDAATRETDDLVDRWLI